MQKSETNTGIALSPFLFSGETCRRSTVGQPVPIAPETIHNHDIA